VRQRMTLPLSASIPGMKPGLIIRAGCGDPLVLQVIAITKPHGEGVLTVGLRGAQGWEWTRCDDRDKGERVNSPIGGEASAGSFHRRAHCGIGRLKLRLRGRASGDGNDRKQRKEAVYRSPVIGHRAVATHSVRTRRLCNHSGEDQAAYLAVVCAASRTITSL
jgi:hypothetical protein